jgi:hypothetical protein
MQLVPDSKTEAEPRNRIWFLPQKFWQATKNMSKEQASNLMSEVETYAAAQDFQALSKYPFVVVGDPYKRNRARRSA